MSLVIGPIGTYDNARASEAVVGATAIRPGDLIKFSAGLMVPCAADDKQIQVFVALGYGAVGAKIPMVPLADAKIKIAYTGSAPTIGAAYAISDQRTLDQTDTTNKLLTVVKVGSDAGLDAGTCEAIEYRLAS